MGKVLRFILVLWACGASLAHAEAAPVRLLVLGDSLSAGFNLPHDWAFPVKLEQALRAKGREVTVINASVSGDTTAGGLARLDWVLADKPDAVILELGGNDGLRGLDPAISADNLSAIIARLKSQRIKVLLAGMQAPPNLGKDYAAEFNQLYPRLAKTHGVALYPFILKGVIDQPTHLQPDGVHPNMKGVEAMVREILPFVEKLLGWP
ncbi:MAG: arylesterase [Alphaproteobacteria bacterium RIFOXYD12_FULL_60_8]|nr:MAG: arylesterase [Alphaproteobacteria bacterium RIFOXYD12_FULL_60_8]